MILMIDNYDSFTYNIVQYLGELGANVKVVRNDMISTKDIEYMEPEKIVISPGPCTPKEAGISIDAINEPTAYMVAKKLIEKSQTPNQQLISDTKFNLKLLLKNFK